MPLELEFIGNFFNLADFFHDVKRFVRVANNNVVVNGRLVTSRASASPATPASSRASRRELKATIYLSPQGQGATAGATPRGPRPATTPAARRPASDGSTPRPLTPTAAATP